MKWGWRKRRWREEGGGGLGVREGGQASAGWVGVGVQAGWVGVQAGGGTGGPPVPTRWHGNC
jgi:hypothetical protein